MNNIPRFPSEERIFSTPTKSSGKKMMLMRSKQTSVDWTIGLVLKFCRAVGLILDTFANKLGAAQSVFQLPEHLWFSGYDKDPYASRMHFYLPQECTQSRLSV